MKEKWTNVETDTSTYLARHYVFSLPMTNGGLPKSLNRLIKHFDPTDTYKTLLQQMVNTHPLMVLATLNPGVLEEGGKAHPAPLCSPHHGAFPVSSEH